MVKIRLAKKEDFEMIIKMRKEWAKEGISWGVFPATKKEILKTLRKSIFFVAEDSKDVIGFIEREISKSDGDIPVFNIKKWQYYGELNDLYINKNLKRLSDFYKKFGLKERILEMAIKK